MTSGPGRLATGPVPWIDSITGFALSMPAPDVEMTVK
jgi:hypothetical protein